MYKILTLNHIAKSGLETFDPKKYQIGPEITNPDAIIVRSFDLHNYTIPESAQVIGRAGAGVNNIPIASLTQRGIPVFNTPGANANAVKELVITAILLACRNICPAWDYVKQLQGDAKSMHEQVEKQKKQFSGFELPGKTLGIIGLGHIGVSVANTALDLGMKVIGYDPAITVKNAWQLSASVQQAEHLQEVFAHADFITLHVPFTKNTENFIQAKQLQQMKKGAVLLNFSRDGIVHHKDLLQAIESGQLRNYVCDFPDPLFNNHPHIICLPHLGASTQEAEENCAVMVAQQIQHYLEDGRIKNAVNFPEVHMPRTAGSRLAIVNENVPKMVAQISTVLSDANINILDLINKSQGEVAYNLIDTNTPMSEMLIKEIAQIPGVLKVREIPHF
jgi:D-3-phosphoglycerate dehydrogenase